MGKRGEREGGWERIRASERVDERDEIVGEEE